MPEKRSYEIQYTKAADKFLNRHEEYRRQYEKAIRELLTGDHPEKTDVKRIRGKHNDYFRIRLGDVRIIYTIVQNKIIVVLTLLAGTRGDICKKMGGLD